MLGVCAVFGCLEGCALALVSLDFYVYKEARLPAWLGQSIAGAGLGLPRQSACSHAHSMSMSFVISLGAWAPDLVLGMGPGHSVWEMQKFVCGTQAQSGGSPLPEAARPGTSAARNVHHMKVTRVLSAPSDHTFALRLLSGQGLGCCIGRPRRQLMWIIASFPVTTVPATCAGRLPNTSWIPLHSTWCTSSVVSMSAAHLIKN